MLSSHRFLCLPLRLPPWTVPCRMVLASVDDRVTCPYHFSLCLFTEVRSSYGLKAFPILAFTSSLVMWSLYEIPKSLQKHLISNACYSTPTASSRLASLRCAHATQTFWLQNIYCSTASYMMLWDGRVARTSTTEGQVLWYHGGAEVCLFVGWLFNVPATCECISGTDLLRQFYVLPHWDRSCRSNFPSHPVTVYWHQADQSQRWPYNARCLAG